MLCKGKRKFFVFWFIFVIIVISLTACARGPEQRPSPPPADDMRWDESNQNLQGKGNMKKSDTPDRITPSGQKQLADDLAIVAEKVKGVRSAAVVVTLDTAIVGIKLENNLKPQNSVKIKKEVEEALKKVQPGIDNVSVTADPDLVRRIEGIAEGIASGRPVTQFTQEISDILTRINPQ